MSEPEDNPLDTKPLPHEALAVIGKALARAPKYSLILYHRDGSQIVSLAAGSSVVLGREAPSEVIVRDESLSRMHARITLEGDEVVIEDLQSTNGTRVDGETITSASVKPGSEITFGAIPAALHVMAPAEAKTLGLDSHDRFSSLLEEEVVRSKHFARTFALLMVRASREKDGAQTRWYERVRGLLRTVDRAALYAPGHVEIVIPECTAEDAERVARQIVDGRAEGEPFLFCGVARYPDAGTTADALVEASRDASYRATSKRPIANATEDAPEPSRSVGRTTDADTRPIVASAVMKRVFETIDRVATSAIPVLVLGETGTGKEVVARSIHELGPRKASRLMSVNCGAIPAQLLESTLFGHEKGAFTGAVQDQKGIFEAAHGGTVFLDEIGELPANAQAALLRVLETKRITRVGSTREREVDVRMIAATHRDLEAMCREGTFRWDLFYRLNVMTLAIPPLRERKEEIPLLAERFVRGANLANGREVRGLDPEAMQMLEAYTWPGNVRELKNAIDRAVVIASGTMIAPEDLPERVRNVPIAIASTPADTLEPGGSGDTGDFKEQMQKHEVQVILDALDRAGGNQTKAAKLLGMPLRTLVHKIKTLEIVRKGYGSSDD